MKTATTNSLQVSQTIRADQETVFRAWTDPDALKHWWRMKGEGWTFAGASLDLRVGGRFRLSMFAPDGATHTAVGEYTKIQRPTLLAFTWNWEDPAHDVGDSLVTVEFRNAGDDSTEVVLTHERFADESRVAGHESGWTQLLGLLDHYIVEKAQ